MTLRRCRFCGRVLGSGVRRGDAKREASHCEENPSHTCDWGAECAEQRLGQRETRDG